jgi:hypothetical protein
VCRRMSATSEEMSGLRSADYRDTVLPATILIGCGMLLGNRSAPLDAHE